MSRGSEKVTKLKTFFAGLALAASLASAGAVVAQEHGGGQEAKQIDWSFSGPFGTYDVNQLRRGFQVFREVCSNCHSARLLAFRNLAEEGGPGYSADQVKLLASQYDIADPAADGGTRPGVAADHWPAPFATEQDARDSNNGALPPDMSVLAKARGIEMAFPYWVFNYFTGYQEGGPDFIYNVLTSYTDPPEGVTIPPGQYYNAFLGHGISMPPPLSDELVSYAEGEGGASVPMTVEQYAKDVSAFLMWVADPHLVARKELGFRVILFLIVFAGLMYMVKRRLSAQIAH